MAKRQTSIFKKPDLSDNLEAIEKLKRKRHWDGDTLGRLYITRKLLLHTPADTEPADDENQTYSTSLADSLPDDLITRRIGLASKDELKTVAQWDANIYRSFLFEYRRAADASMQGTSNVKSLMGLLEPVRIAETAAPYIDGTPKPLKAVYDDMFMLELFGAEHPLDMESLNNLAHYIYLILDDCVNINGYNNIVDATKKAYQIPLFERYRYTEPFLQDMINRYNKLLDQTLYAIKHNTKNDDTDRTFKLDIIHTIFKPIDMASCYVLSKEEVGELLTEQAKQHDFRIFDGGSRIARSLSINAYNWDLFYTGLTTLPEDIAKIWQNYRTHKND